jgi:hypothetical protein
MDMTKFLQGIDALYASWRCYSDRVVKVRAGLPDVFHLDSLIETERWLYTRIQERFYAARDLGLELPQDRAWSWMPDSPWREV